MCDRLNKIKFAVSHKIDWVAQTVPRIKFDNNDSLQNTHMQKWPVLKKDSVKQSQEFMWHYVSEGQRMQYH